MYIYRYRYSAISDSDTIPTKLRHRVRGRQRSRQSGKFISVEVQGERAREAIAEYTQKINTDMYRNIHIAYISQPWQC